MTIHYVSYDTLEVENGLTKTRAPDLHRTGHALERNAEIPFP
jgi:hypothetical protein